MYILLGYLLALLSSIITINGVPVTPLPNTNTNEYYCLGFLVHAPEIIYDNVNPFDLHSHVTDVVHDPSTSELEDMTKSSDHDSDTNENYIDNSKDNEDSVNEQLDEQQTNLISNDIEPIKRRRRRRDNTELEQNKSPTLEDVDSNTPTVDESKKTDPDTETNEKSSENTEITTITSPSSSIDDKENQQQQEEETLPQTIKCFEQKRERYNLNRLIHRYKSILFDLNIFQ